MNFTIVRRSVTIAGHRIDIRIEDLFWISLEEIARAEATTMPRLVALIDARREGADLTSAIRVYVIDHFMAKIENLDSMDDDAPESAPRTCAAQYRPGARPRCLN